MERKIARVETAAPPGRSAPTHANRMVIAPEDFASRSPFLMMAEDWFAPPSGFPTHPHRGMETVTMVLEGQMVPDTAERKFLETIHHHATRLSRVAADLATLSEIENPSASQQFAPISIRMVVAAAARAIEREAVSRQVTLVAEDLPDVQVYGQQLRLEQAMVNLLDNAVRFNQEGGEVRVSSEVTGDEQLRVTVADTGIGIPREHLARIFERFYRVDKARSRETGGTGLGLSIVKHVAEQMHGRVQVESTLGKGTRFTLILPLTSYHEADGSLVERAAGAYSRANGGPD